MARFGWLHMHAWQGVLLGLLLGMVFALLRPMGSVMAQENGDRKDVVSRTCYEVFVYSFYDSDGDGIGDLKGVERKLDHIGTGNSIDKNDYEEEPNIDMNDAKAEIAEDAASTEDTELIQGLGCDILWLMPIFESPSYHKYDVTDYTQVDPIYGTWEDFDDLVEACHARGIRLILDLPVNHTSWEHPWFVEAAAYMRSLPAGEQPDHEACPYADYYNFREEGGSGYVQLDGTDWYYEARFWEGMPDLNLDNPAVREEIRAITDLWQERGVDGFRLDAVTYYYTEDTQASIDFLGWLTATVKQKDPDAYLVGEAWTDLDTYAKYYASGIDSLFDFNFAGQEGIIAGVARGKKAASLYGEKIVHEEEVFAQYTQNMINAPFYTNHDMARSAGYYTGDDGSRTKLAEALNLLMPGNAFLYYGEELGMKGSGKDENKRAPMYWSSDADTSESSEASDPGMCVGPPDMDDVEMKFPSWREQKDNPTSILSYVREAIRVRREHPAIALGKTTLLEDLSDKTLCTMLREAQGEESMMLLINTADEPRDVELETYAANTGMEDLKMVDMLCVGKDAVTFEDGVLTIPAFGIAVMEVG